MIPWRGRVASHFHRANQGLAYLFSGGTAADTTPPSADMPEFDTHLIAFYLPQFHPIPENDAWWGKGFTEWRNVVHARPLFAGHYQPHLPADLGFYDLRVPETRAEQAALAREHGIHGFCYYYYWFNGRRLLERPLDEVHRSGSPDFPFCVCWANENWTRRWDGHDDDDPDRAAVFARRRSPPGRGPRAALPRSRATSASDDRPLFIVYRAGSLPDPPAFAERFREQAKRDRTADPFLAYVHLPDLPSPEQWGFDAAVEFPPHGLEAGEVTPPVEFHSPDARGEGLGLRADREIRDRPSRCRITACSAAS